jgi:peptide/nickel transport system ATP-binding protein
MIGVGRPSPPLLSVRGLEVQFATEDGMTPVVQDVSFDVAPGEVLGLVGESGCGKSVTSLSIMRLITDPPGRITQGEILFEGRDLLSLSEREMQTVRGGRIAMVFQEPMTSLDPAFTVGEQIAAAYRRHRGGTKRTAWERAVEMLDLVGIPAARQRAKEYPHMFSGGMRQRVVVAIALSCEPPLLIADEPTTALDVTIQAQVLDLLQDLQSRMGMAIVFVTHDLGVVSQVCDRVVVMYAGQVVETSATRPIFERPQHPYTHGLLECLPSEHIGERLRPIPGTVPAATAMPRGCRFHPRCPHAQAGRCDVESVPLFELAGRRAARCVRVDELILPGVHP